MAATEKAIVIINIAMGGKYGFASGSYSLCSCPEIFFSPTSNLLRFGFEAKYKTESTQRLTT